MRRRGVVYKWKGKKKNEPRWQSSQHPNHTTMTHHYGSHHYDAIKSTSKSHHILLGLKVKSLLHNQYYMCFDIEEGAPPCMKWG